MGRVAGDVFLQHPCHTTGSNPWTRSSSAQPFSASPRENYMDQQPMVMGDDGVLTRAGRNVVSPNTFNLLARSFFSHQL